MTSLDMCSKRSRILCRLYRDDEEGACQKCLVGTFVIIGILLAPVLIIFLPVFIGRTMTLHFGPDFLGDPSRECALSKDGACWVIGAFFSFSLPLMLFGLFHLSKSIYHEFKEKSAKAIMIELKVQQ